MFAYIGKWGKFFCLKIILQVSVCFIFVVKLWLPSLRIKVPCCESLSHIGMYSITNIDLIYMFVFCNVFVQESKQGLSSVQYYVWMKDERNVWWKWKTLPWKLHVPCLLAVFFFLFILFLFYFIIFYSEQHNKNNNIKFNWESTESDVYKQSNRLSLICNIKSHKMFQLLNEVIKID